LRNITVNRDLKKHQLMPHPVGLVSFVPDVEDWEAILSSPCDCQGIEGHSAATFLAVQYHCLASRDDPSHASIVDTPGLT
jgi:hypothetical protein